MKAESYNAKSGYITTLTEEQKNLLKSLYLAGLSMSNTSRISNISLGIVQKFIKMEGLSRDRHESLKMKGKYNDGL